MSLMSAAPFDPLDLRNYSLEKFKDIKPGRIMESLKVYGFPIAVVLFFFFHLRLCGSIELFDAQKVPQLCYSALGIFVASLILWLTETIPNFLTSFIVNRGRGRHRLDEDARGVRHAG